jgi:mRNA interferase MazF
MTTKALRRGDIWWLDWSPGRGSEQEGVRPAVIVQNDLGNEHSRTTIVAAVTTQGQRRFPFFIAVPASQSGLPRDSFVNAAQILTVDKMRLSKRAGRLNQAKMAEVDLALRVSLAL